MTRKTYQIKKQGRIETRIYNLGPEDYTISSDEQDWLDKYPHTSLLHPAEENLLWHMATVVPGDIANLGHSGGGSAIIMGAALKYINSPNSLHSIDIFKSEEQFRIRKETLDQYDINAVLYRGYTSALGEQWTKEGRQFGFTFIDASHEYEDVKKDWELFSPMSKVVGFHDTNQIPTDDVINESVLTGPWKLIHHVMSIKVFEKV